MPAFAQCDPHWDTTLGSSTVDGRILASMMFDDGSGQALYVAGEFQTIGGTAAFGIARTRDGVAWEKVGDAFLFSSGQPFPFARIEALTPFDPDGSGPQPPLLVVGGTFELAENGNAFVNHVASWNGTSWSPIGGGLPGTGDGDFSVHVTSLASFDSGTGPRLYAGGNFEVGGVPNADVAVWDGFSWQPLGFTGTTADGVVTDLIVHDDGSGPALYVAGDFDGIVGVPNSANVARWDGSAWSSLAGGPTFATSDRTINLASFDPDGAGGAPARLLAFSWCSHRVDQWNGTTWTSSVLPSQAWCGGKGGLAVFDQGSGPAVYFGGTIAASNTTHVIRYDGTTFTVTPDALLAADGSMSIASTGINTLGAEPSLFIGGGTLGPDLVRAQGMMTFANAALSSVAPIGGPSSQFSLTPAAGNQVTTLTAFDADGDGPGLPIMVAGGNFYAMGGVVSNKVAARVGSAWTTLGNGLPDADAVNLVESIPSGSGNDLYAAAYTFVPAQNGQNGGVFKYSGGAWAPVGAPFAFAGSVGGPGYVTCLSSADFGGGDTLFAAGTFLSVDGVTTGRVASWSGSAWEQVGAPGAGIANGDISSLVPFDSGSGPALFIAGDLIRIGAGPSFTTVARWNGAFWSSAAAGLPPFVKPALHRFNDQLWAVVSDGGDMDAPKTLFRWNGSSWAAITSTPFFDLTRFIGVAHSVDGDRFFFNSLDASLGFTGLSISSVGVFEYDGTSWSNSSVLGRMTFDFATAVEALDAGVERSVWFAGGFAGVGGEAAPTTVQTLNAVDSPRIARFVEVCGPSCPPCAADYDNNGGVDGGDLAAFFADFEAGENCADVDGNGGVDGGDLGYFFSVFEAGGC
jgi:hypothetical protein